MKSELHVGWGWYDGGMSGGDDSCFGNVRVVLVETSHPGNIGAAARAMKNMGLTRLALVKPLRFPDEAARRRAAGAEDLLDAAQVVASLDEAIHDCQLVIGTSARDRRLTWPMLTPEACARQALAEAEAGAQVALLFGRESRGLKNEELQRCQFHVNIPTSQRYASLNLAMAVQLLAYELLKAHLQKERQKAQQKGQQGGTAGQPAPPWDMPLTDAGAEQLLKAQQGLPDGARWDMPLADSAAVEHLLKHLEATLVQLDFHDPDNPRRLMPRLRRMFQRIRLDKMEVSILRGILNAINTRDKP